MVKQPQGTLGYFVNGILVHMPKRCQSLPSSTSDEKVVYRQKRVATKRELEYRQKFFRENQIKSSRCEPETFRTLKNQTKCGDLKGVLCTLSKQCNQYKWRNHGKYNFSDLVEPLFMPDYDERRSAIYYACLTGKIILVRTYLSLRVVARLSDNYGRFMYAEANCFANGKVRRKTFREWLDLLGYSAPGMLFHASDFDLCVLNSLSEEIKELMTQKKYSIIDMFEMISSKGNLWMKDQIKEVEKKVRHGFEVMRVKMKKKSTKRPLLNTNDDLYDCDYDYERDAFYDESDFEFLSDVEEYEDDQLQDTHVEETETSPVSEPDQAHQTADTSSSEGDLRTVPDDASEFDGPSVADTTITTTATSWNRIDNDDAACEEDWSVLDASKSETCDEWDVVSETPSVDTFSTFSTFASSTKIGVVSSYKAALLLKPNSGDHEVVNIESVNKKVGKKTTESDKQEQSDARVE